MANSALFDLSGRVVIVTGGARGIGLVYCERLAAAGARVVPADIELAETERAAGQIMRDGGEALAAHCDVADAKSVAAMVAAVVARYGRVDALINNAALMSSLPRGAWHEIDIVDWDRVMAVNLRGMFLCCRAVYPHMKRQGGGKIVNISSGRIWDGTPNRLHYSTSKAGVIGFTRSLAREVGDDNIAVNAITPGFTASDSQMGTSDPAYLKRMSVLNERKSFKRTQMPDDLVGTVMFLISGASDFITGQTINVDGGTNMH